jgi:hypothetical protein
VASPDKKAYLLRLPHEVWGQIERLAAAELRSVNGQIEYLLRESLARRMGSDALAPSPGDDGRLVPEKSRKSARGRAK